MTFDFNAYSTPLLFGFLQAWLYAILFWLRAWRQERLSDALFGALLIAFAFEIWEYMLGFAGIEILWRELEFFPRNFSWLLPPLAWFYLRSQVNADFRFQARDAWHLAPFGLYCAYHLAVFFQGPEFVASWKQQVHYPWGIEIVSRLAPVLLQAVYFWKAYQLYRHYRSWAPSQFSDTDSVSFIWFRNFLLAFLASNLIGWTMTLADIWLALDFWHDWWDELFNAGLIYYLCIAGYAQTQPRRIQFEPDAPALPDAPAGRLDRISEEELAGWKRRIETLMREEQLFLEPELTLNDLARRLHTNASILSAVINRAFSKNFNDFINAYRVEAFKSYAHDPAYAHLSLLGMGLASGFNSKSTFNRAFKKATGLSPGEFVAQKQEGTG